MPIGEYNALKYIINKLMIEEDLEMEEAKERAEKKAKSITSGIGKPRGVGMKR